MFDSIKSPKKSHRKIRRITYLGLPHPSYTARLDPNLVNEWTSGLTKQGKGMVFSALEDFAQECPTVEFQSITIVDLDRFRHCLRNFGYTSGVVERKVKILASFKDYLATNLVDKPHDIGPRLTLLVGKKSETTTQEQKTNNSNSPSLLEARLLFKVAELVAPAIEDLLLVFCYFFDIPISEFFSFSVSDTNLCQLGARK